MAGSKTRFGFLGNGDEPPDSGDPKAARTIIGHDIHLPKLPSGFEQPSPHLPPTPLAPARIAYPRSRPAAVLAPMTEVITESVAVRRHYKPQQSRLARFLGRWTRSGHFQSRSRMGDSQADSGDDGLDVPHDTAGRNVLLVLVIAALTFLITFAIVKARQRYAAVPSVPGTQVAEPPTVSQSPRPVVPASVAPAVALPPAPTAPEKPMLLGTPTSRAVAPPAGRPQAQPAPHATARTATKPVPRKAVARPDSTTFELPDHLKGELLPLGH